MRPGLMRAGSRVSILLVAMMTCKAQNKASEDVPFGVKFLLLDQKEIPSGYFEKACAENWLVYCAGTQSLPKINDIQLLGNVLAWALP